MESNKQKFYQKSSFYIAIFATLVILAAVLIFMLVNNNNNSTAVNSGSVVSDTEKGQEVDGVAGNQGEDGDLKIVVGNDTIDVDGAVAVNAPEIKNLTQPVSGEVIYKFREPITDETDKKNKTPRGIGVTSEIDSDVKASADGVVEFVGDNTLFGKTVVINHNDSFKTVYSNLNKEVKVAEGDNVKAGDVIGGIGDTAVYFVNAKYNPHLHFEVIASNKTYEDVMANYNKNYDVFVDPAEYIEFTKQ